LNIIAQICCHFTCCEILSFEYGHHAYA